MGGGVEVVVNLRMNEGFKMLGAFKNMLRCRTLGV